MKECPNCSLTRVDTDSMSPSQGHDTGSVIICKVCGAKLE